MQTCVCSSCKHLKSFIDENALEDNSINEVCVFGYPAEGCSTCDLEGCDHTCSHYEVEDSEDVQVIMKNCAICNKALEVVEGSSDVEAVYCVPCYLSKH